MCVKLFLPHSASLPPFSALPFDLGSPIFVPWPRIRTDGRAGDALGSCRGRVSVQPTAPSPPSAPDQAAQPRAGRFMHGILDRMLGVANPEPVC